MVQGCGLHKGQHKHHLLSHRNLGYRSLWRMVENFSSAIDIVFRDESVESINDGVVLRNLTRSEATRKSMMSENIHFSVAIRAVDLIRGKRKTEVHF